MEVIYYDNSIEVPPYYTGIIIYPTSAKSWWNKGTLHRVDGPAIIWIPESDDVEWWLHGKKYESSEKWFDALNDEEKEKAIWNMNEWK